MDPHVLDHRGVRHRDDLHGEGGRGVAPNGVGILLVTTNIILLLLLLLLTIMMILINQNNRNHHNNDNNHYSVVCFITVQYHDSVLHAGADPSGQDGQLVRDGPALAVLRGGADMPTWLRVNNNQ